MSKLHAQLALYGTIDWVVRHSSHPETVKMVEDFLPGTTGVGQQGWFDELQRFLNKPQLKPLDDEGRPRTNILTFPFYGDAVNELSGQGVEEEEASPGVKSRTLFASTILSKAMMSEGLDFPPIPGGGPSEGVPDPLDALLPSIVRPADSSGPFRWRDKTLETDADVKAALRDIQTRADYQDFTRALVDTRMLEPEVGNQSPACTGSLRKLHGQFATLLTTSWDPPYTMGQLKRCVDPHNWPDLCDFFVSINDNPNQLQPNLSRGWTRVLETVSSDRTQWQMVTALKYWKGRGADGGIFINYDLDNPRLGDCDLVEVDAGYVWVTPVNPNDPDSPIRLRTCKQVRIRGLSATATAALGCFMGWGDAMCQMFGPKVTDAGAARHEFEPPSTDPGALAGATSQPAKDPTDDQIIAEAEDVELLDGWRGLMIKNVAKELVDGVDVAAGLATDFMSKWIDGMTVDDVKTFGAKFGNDTTTFATNMFTAAAGALQPTAADLAESAEGKV